MLDGASGREAYDKICELSTSYHIALTRAVAVDMIETMKHGSSEEKLEPPGAVSKATWMILYAEIDHLSERPQRYEPSSFSTGAGGGPPSKLEFLKEEVIRLTGEAGDEAVEPVGRLLPPRPQRRFGRDQAAGQDRGLDQAVPGRERRRAQSVLDAAWVMRIGCRRDVPRCVCQVGQLSRVAPGRVLYIWITPDRYMKTFRDFVLIILSIAPPEATRVDDRDRTGRREQS